MRRLNLLPDRLLHERALRRRRALTAALALAALTATVAWAAAARAHVQRLDARIAAAEQALQSLRHRESRHRRLEARRNAAGWLREPIPPAAILALLSQLAPAEAALVELELRVPPPLAATGKPGEGAIAFRAEPAEISLDGVATDDLIVALFVSRLTESKLFERVYLEESREIEMAGRARQRFRIAATMPMEGLPAGLETATAHE